MPCCRFTACRLCAIPVDPDHISTATAPLRKVLLQGDVMLHKCYGNADMRIQAPDGDWIASPA